MKQIKFKSLQKGEAKSEFRLTCIAAESLYCCWKLGPVSLNLSFEYVQSIIQIWLDDK